MTPSPPACDCLCAGIVVADFVCAPVAQVPPAGGVMMTDSITPAIGGCASNVATDLARLGRRALVAGRVGSDMPGRFVRDQLVANGVDTARLLETPGVQTSSTLVINVRNEDRRFIHTFGANALFDGSEIPAVHVRRAKVLYLGGYCLMPGLAPDRVADLFRLAREAHVPTVLDVVIPDSRSYREQVERVLPWTDVFLPNLDEARELTGLDDPLEQARHFRAAGAGTVVITCGREGAFLLSASDSLRARSFPVDFVDGTGSGDAFAAGFISALIEGCGPERCLEMGSALGASCVRQAGATTGVFRRGELEEFLQQNRLPIERL
jgi:sugar/nucleoside kinase (ribokinase family)